MEHIFSWQNIKRLRQWALTIEQCSRSCLQSTRTFEVYDETISMLDDEQTVQQVPEIDVLLPVMLDFPNAVSNASSLYIASSQRI